MKRRKVSTTDYLRNQKRRRRLRWFVSWIVMFHRVCRITNKRNVNIVKKNLENKKKLPD
jgi:hypothetical protein